MSDAHDERVIEQALAALHRVPEGAKPAEQQEVQRFMARSTQHRVTMLRMLALWERTDELTDLPWPTAAEIAADLDAEPAVAAPQQLQSEALPAQSERQVATRFERMTAARLRPLAVAAAIAVAVIGLALLMPSFFGPGETIRTATAQHRAVALPDASEMVLGARSSAQVRYSRRAREVLLSEGEALFAVRADPSRRFTVHCADAAIHAIGTEFNVRRRGDQIVVTVLEGVVRIAASAEGRSGALRASAAGAPGVRELRARQRITFDRTHGFGAVQQVPAADAAAWRRGWMVFDGETLAAVVDDVSRYSAVPIVVADEAAAGLRYTGTVHLDQIERWIEALPAVFAVAVRHEQARIVVQSSNSG